jgi:hypothetical protein
MASTTIAVRLPVQLRAEALALASIRGQSLSEFVRDSIDRELSVDSRDLHVDRQQREWAHRQRRDQLLEQERHDRLSQAARRRMKRAFKGL